MYEEVQVWKRKGGKAEGDLGYLEEAKGKATKQISAKIFEDDLEYIEAEAERLKVKRNVFVRALIRYAVQAHRAGLVR